MVVMMMRRRGLAGAVRCRLGTARTCGKIVVVVVLWKKRSPPPLVQALGRRRHRGRRRRLGRLQTAAHIVVVVVAVAVRRAKGRLLARALARRRGIGAVGLVAASG